MSNNVAIGWDNLLEQATDITASGEQQFFEAINIIDWRTNTVWKGVPAFNHEIIATFLSAREPSGFAIFHHNFNSFGTTVYVSYWSGSEWIDVITPLTFPFDGVIMQEFDLPTAPSNQWRILISTGIDPSEPIITHWFLGDFLRVKSQKPTFGPAIYNDTSKFRTELSESGQFLGRTFESTDAVTSIGLDLLQPSDVENFIFRWIQHAKYYPFYYSWDFVNKPEQAAYCWTERPIQVSYYKTPSFMRLNARLSARVS